MSRGNLITDNARYVRIGEIVVAQSPAILSTVLSSCVALIIYDGVSKRGAMGHILVGGEGSGEGNVTQFSDPAARQLISNIRENSRPDSKLIAKIIGGASSGSSLNNNSFLNNISNNTVCRVVAYVLNEGIVVAGMHTGGKNSRRVFFDLESGEVKVQIDGESVIV